MKTAFIRYNSDIPPLCFDYKYDNSQQLLDRENPLSVQIYVIMGHCVMATPGRAAERNSEAN